MVSYNIIIHALCEMGPLDVALLVLRQLEGNGKQPDLVTFKTLLNAPYRNHRCSKDEKMGAMMETKNVVKSYNSRLRGMFHDGRKEEAGELVGEMERGLDLMLLLTML